MGAKPEPEKTEKRGADTGPGLIAKWQRRAKSGQRRDPGITGIWQNKRLVLTLDSLRGGNMNISARRLKNQICPCNNLGGNLPRVVGYEIRFEQKGKKCG